MPGAKQTRSRLAALTATLLLLFTACTAAPEEEAGVRTAADSSSSEASLPEERDIPLDEVDWTIEVEGAKASSFTLAEAGEMSLAKIYGGFHTRAGGLATVVFEGVRFSDFLEKVGARGATSVTIIDTDGKEHAVNPVLISDDRTVLTWIMNKTMSITGSESHVAFASAAEAGGADDTVLSVAKIVVGADAEVERYAYLRDIPDNWDEKGNPRAVVEGLMTAGLLAGDGSDPTGNGDVIDVSRDMLRIWAIEFRAGFYDAAFKAAGIDPGKLR